MRISLTRKVLSLVSVILLSEIFFVLSIAALETQAEKEATRALRSQAISENINHLLRRVYEVYGVIENGQDNYFTFDNSTYQREIDEIELLLAKLKKSVSDDPAQKKIVNKASKSLGSALELLEVLTSRPKERSQWTDVFKAKRKGLWRQVRAYLSVLNSEEFMELNRAEKAIAEKSPEKMAEYRKQMKIVLFGGLALNVLLSLLLALFLVRTITERIRLMNDNTVKLASGLALNPPIGGNDEIAELDSVFHVMAAELEEAARKERAVLDNVKDMVCSIDGQGRFTALNPAVESVLGYERENLLGSHLVDLILSDDAATVLSAIDAIKKGEDARPIEARIRHKDGRIIQTHWSVQWSLEEQSLFCVVHDITERIELEQLKQNVISMITHDLRSPLTSIMAFHEMLESGMLGEISEQGNNLGKIAVRSSKRMLALINDLLDVEKARSGAMEIERENLDLASILEQTVESFAAPASKRNLSFEIEPCESRVFVDEAKISRVLQNLVANAIKFAPHGSVIFLKTRRYQGMIEVSVIDSGPGIEADKLHRVFDRFQQVHSDKSSTEGGSGLGLAICKAIVELHGGEIGVKSLPGEGTTFYFTIAESTDA